MSAGRRVAGALGGLPLLLLCLCLCVGRAGAQASAITIGLTLPLSGPDSAYGLGLLHGAQLAVARANAAGGVAGRPLALVSLDDAGGAGKAAANARQLIERGAVAIAAVHAARSVAAVAEVIAASPGGPLAALVAPASGAELLREPVRPGVFHLRAGVGDEAGAAVLHLDTIGVTRYALVAQADALGDSGRERILIELTRLALRPVMTERVDHAAPPQVAQEVMARVCAQRPEAVILAIDAALVRAAMAAARRQPCATHYVVFSEAGAALAAQHDGTTGAHSLAGLLVTQVVPHPSNALHPLVSEYQAALATHGASPGSHPSLEAYLAVRLIQEALRPCGRDPQRACLLQSLAARSHELPGMKVQMGAAQRQARPFVEITLLDAQGRFRR